MKDLINNLSGIILLLIILVPALVAAYIVAIPMGLAMTAVVILGFFRK